MYLLSEVYIETLFVEINLCEWTTYIGTIYKPQSADCNIFIQSIQHILSTNNQSKIYDLMLCGDFNIDILYIFFTIRFYLWTQYIHCHFCRLSVNRLRVTHNSATLLDNFFNNEPCNFDGHTNFWYFKPWVYIID